MSEQAGFSTTVQVSDDVTGPLSRLARNVGNLDPALAEMGSQLQAQTEMRFEFEEDPYGTAWEGLAAVTLAKRGREGADGEARILRDNEDLYDSLGWEVDPGRSVTVGVSSVYGRIHQLGGFTGRGLATYIPPRPYLGVGLDDLEQLVEILERHATQGVS